MQDFFFLQVSGITPGRAMSLIAGALALISVIVGWRVLAGSTDRMGANRTKALVSLVLALISMVFSGWHLLRATGGFGTGSGKLGAIVALVLALTGAIISGKALARFRRITAGK